MLEIRHYIYWSWLVVSGQYVTIQICYVTPKMAPFRRPERDLNMLEKTGGFNPSISITNMYNFLNLGHRQSPSNMTVFNGKKNIFYHINDVPATRLAMNKHVFPPLRVDRYPPKSRSEFETPPKRWHYTMVLEIPDSPWMAALAKIDPQNTTIKKIYMPFSSRISSTKMCTLLPSLTPLKNMKVSWDGCSQYMESHTNQVPNHQSVYIILSNIHYYPSLTIINHYTIYIRSISLI